MAKWGKINCPRCEMLEEHLCLTEEKLAKAVEFTKGVIRHAGNSGDDYLAEQARAILAELKGQDDE